MNGPSGIPPGAPPPPPPPFPPPAFIPPLPPGWTEHRAPAGQPYWFHPASNVSTYVRPLPPPGFFPPPPPPPQPLPPLHFGGGGPPAEPAKEKKEKKEKPKTKTPIAGTEWTKVVTNKGNVFWTNRETKQSVWTVPDEIKPLVDRLERDEQEAASGGLKRKAGDADGEKPESVDADGDEGDLAISDAAPKPEEAAPEEPPKKKKQKKRVVHDLRELQDEDWKRDPAPESDGAPETEPHDDDEPAEKQAVPEAVAAPPAATVAVVPVPDAFIPPPRGHQQHIPRIDVSPEEGAALFKAMLAEKDISPMAPWDMELPKFVNDPRYLAVKQLKDRHDLFDEFCKIKIREMRAAKKAAQEAGGPKPDPLAAYRALLLSTVTSTRTHFSDFKRAHSKDPRFREFGKTEGDREKVFKVWLRELGERKRAEATKAEERFTEMLREDRTIKPGDKWADVKIRHVRDPRYDAVNSSSLRESLFTQYASSLAEGGSSAKGDRAARAAASLREREEQVRSEKERMGRNANAARGALGREEAEREFKSLLIDTVRDHEARWDAVAAGLEADPRFGNSSLSLHDKRRLFDGHLTEVYTKRVAALEALFLSASPGLDTSFDAVLPSVADTPQATRLVGSDTRRLQGLFDTWKRKRETQARSEFDDLLKESPIIDHWGRLQKEAKEKDGNAIDVPDEDEDEADEGALDVTEMAKQIDLKAIHAVLKHDRRYLIFDHEPEKRNEWIKDFLANLSAPKLTAHQRD